MCSAANNNLELRKKTVRSYVSGVLDEPGLSNRIELATYAVQHHISTYLNSKG